MTEKPLSSEMASALAVMRERGSLVYRGSLSSWTAPGQERIGPWFRTQTIKALEARELIFYTDWMVRANGQSRYPIACEPMPVSEERDAA